MSQFLNADELRAGRCLPCEGGVPALSAQEAEQQLQALNGWRLLSSPDRIQKSWTVKNFVAGIDFFRTVAELAEQEAHHPDLHLSGYRNVSIEIWTHAINGLSLNDFVLAAKIDQLPVQLKSNG